MANILITDLFEESAYLVRSLLRGVGHAVSISITRKDAEAKLSTGLFDVLMVDYCSLVEENLAVGKFANEMLPGMPVVALTRPELEKKLAGVQLAAKYYRPLRGRNVKEVLNVALAGMYRETRRRAVPRIHTDLPISVDLAGVTFASRTIDLSSRGVAIDATEVKLTPDQLEAIENAVGQACANASLTIDQGRVIQLKGRIAFVERHRSLSGRTIGLAFEGLDEQSEVAIAGLYRDAA